MDLTWKEYTNDRLIAEHPSGFYLIRPKQPETHRPLFCPVCDAVMTSHYDEDAYKKFECCDGCANRWAYKDPEKWSSGWRPTTEEIQHNCDVSHI